MDFLRNNRLEIKMIVSSRAACCIVGGLDLIFMATFIGIHITELLHCQRELGVMGILISLLVIAVINFNLALILLMGTKQKNLGKCQLYTISWLLSWVALLILFIIFLINFLPISTYTLKVAPYSALFYTQTVLYPILLLYKPPSLLFVYKFTMDVIRSRRERQNSSTHQRRESRNTNKNAFGLTQLQLPNQGNGIYNPVKSPSPSTTPFRYGTAPRGRRSSETYERVQGVDDLMHQMEFPMDHHVSSSQFQIGETLLKMEHDFFVKQGSLLVPKKGGGGGFGLSIPHSTPEDIYDKVQVAIKIFRQNVDVEAVRRMLLETKILTMFRKHNNVIKLLGFCTENIHKGKMTLILEYCAKGTLEDYLTKNYDVFQDLIVNDKFCFKIDHDKSEENIYENIITTPPTTADTNEEQEFIFDSRTLLNWSFQIANGMEFINGNGVIHGNLMAKNCIVDERNRIKIGNFTFATQLYHFKQTNSPIDFVKREIQLPWRWMAIECMNTDPPSECTFTEKSDIWGYGVVIWEVFSLGCIPYDKEFTSEFFPKLKAGDRLEKPPFATSDVYKIMTSCWHSTPLKRPSFTAIKMAFAEILQSIM